MKEVYEKLHNLLEQMTDEQIEAEFKELEKYNEGGVTVEAYIRIASSYIEGNNYMNEIATDGAVSYSDSQLYLAD